MRIFRSKSKAIVTRVIVSASGLLIVPSAVIAIAGLTDNIYTAHADFFELRDLYIRLYLFTDRNFSLVEPGTFLA